METLIVTMPNLDNSNQPACDAVVAEINGVPVLALSDRLPECVRAEIIAQYAPVTA